MNNESQLTMNNIEENQSYFSQESVTESVPTPGSLLEASRKEQNWSVQQVSEQLKLSQAQIIALEANQYHLLPTLVIVRGFVRAYAKLLKIDASPLIALLPKDGKPKALDDSLKPALSTPFIDSKLSLIGRNETNRLYIIGAFVLVLLVAVFLIFQNSFVKNLFNAQFPSSQQKVLVNNNAHNLNLVLPNSSEKSESLKTEEIQVVPVKKIDEVTASSVLPVNGVVGAVPLNKDAVLPEQKVSETKLADVTVNSGKNDLILKFRENSWIQVKTEKGVVIAERLVKAGSEEKFEVNQTLLVRIGNVAGVDASLRGSLLNMSPAAGSNVINLSIK